jgi:hypothetical protein
LQSRRDQSEGAPNRNVAMHELPGSKLFA